MKRSCVAWLGVLIVLGVGLAKADGDPRITLAGAPSDGYVVTGNSWDFTTATGGGNPCTVSGSFIDCVFTNGSGVTWSSLTFNISGNSNSPVTCSVTFGGFSTCNINGPGTQVTYSGGLGISATEFPGDDFEVVLRGWSPDTNFLVTAQSPSVPEPSSLLMLGSGLLGVGGILRRRFAKAS